VKCAIEMGSGALIRMPGFMKIGSGIQKLIRRDSQTTWRSRKPTFIFLNKESRAINRTRAQIILLG
jgi:hypothetical protein